MAVCHGTAADHCCYLGRHGVCQFLEQDTVPGRRWVCRLRRELGDWEAVHRSRRFRMLVRPLLDAAGVVEDCGDWPPPGQTCGTCGVSGG